MTFEELLEAALRLPRSERAALVAQLLDDLDPEPLPSREEWERAWGEEIRRRLEDLDAGRTEAIPWEEVRAELMDDADEA